MKSLKNGRACLGHFPAEFILEQSGVPLNTLMRRGYINENSKYTFVMDTFSYQNFWKKAVEKQNIKATIPLKIYYK